MREIKFRAWRKGSKQMVVVIRLYFGASKSMPELSSFPNSMKYISPEDGLEWWTTSDSFELMQYTGLKDKNGKEIYEGDVVDYLDACSDAAILQTGERERGIITWIEPRCQLMPQDIKENHKGGHYIAHWDFLIEIEVIGNIYENPELLKDND